MKDKNVVEESIDEIGCATIKLEWTMLVNKNPEGVHGIIIGDNMFIKSFMENSFENDEWTEYIPPKMV